MVNVTKLGHAELEVRDLARMSEFYQEVMGLTETGREDGLVYLSTAVDHHSLVLRKGSRTGLTKIAFQVAPAEAGDVADDLRRHGLPAEIRADSQPGIPEVVRTRNTDGVAIELYSSFEPSPHPYSFRGINPLKLSHIASLSPDLHRLVSFYTDVLGFRFSDSMQDFFYFLRCGCDHHTINMAAGQYSAVQHLAFELAVYHFDPEGLIIEHCAELDRMSDERLGYFDPRPYHEDRPQRPKRWDPKAAISVWGRFPPPELFNTGLSDATRGMTTEEGLS